MNDVWLVARREIESRIRSKGFLLGLLASTVAVVAFVVVPSLIDEDDYTVALVGTTSEALAPVVEQLADQAGLEVELVTDRDEAAARASVEEGDLDAVVVDGTRLLTEGEPDGALSALLDSAHQAVTVQQRLTDLGLSAEQQQGALAVAPLTRETVGDEAADSGARTGLALLLMVALLMLLMTSAIGVAIGVVEEKGNRIVEILLVAVRPWQLLTGKLLAFGLLGAVQLVVLGAAGLGTAALTGMTDDLPHGSAVIFAAAAGGYLLGFLFFGSLAAALASLVSRQEEVNGALGPMSALMVGSYLGAFVALQESDSTFAQVISVVPPFSSMVMPVRLATGDVAGWQVLLSVVLTVVAVAVVTLVGGRVYERSVLRTGARVSLVDSLRNS
ncbi:ABC transporter permease [Nocardioides sp. LML1-1-1.1]|uniref:ABC transporter permease n=1 Tax=Nocardioides sp. LML1-1-1.1 TaxID=3135248 RepID=UPI0034495896